MRAFWLGMLLGCSACASSPPPPSDAELQRQAHVAEARRLVAEARGATSGRDIRLSQLATLPPEALADREVVEFAWALLNDPKEVVPARHRALLILHAGNAGFEAERGGPSYWLAQLYPLPSESNAEQVVASLRPQFKRCYDREASDNPAIAGSIRLEIMIGPLGSVTHVGSTPSGNLPGSVVGCVRDQASLALFAPPGAGSSRLEVPVTFLRSGG